MKHNIDNLKIVYSILKILEQQKDVKITLKGITYLAEKSGNV